MPDLKNALESIDGQADAVLNELQLDYLKNLSNLLNNYANYYAELSQNNYELMASYINALSDPETTAEQKVDAIVTLASQPEFNDINELEQNGIYSAYVLNDILKNTTDYSGGSHQLQDILQNWDNQYSPKAGQSAVTSKMEMLGYPRNERGVCYGISSMLIQSILANDLDTFSNRLNYLNTVSNEDFQSFISDNATKLNEQGIDLHAFFNGITLYQNTSNYSELFNRSTGQQDFSIAAPMAASMAFDGKNTLEKVSLPVELYNDELLLNRIDLLQSNLREATSLTQDNVPFIIQNNNHAITISFDRKNKEWLCFDPNELSIKKVAGEDNIELTQLILKSFNSTTTALSFQAVVFNENAAIMNDLFSASQNQYLASTPRLSSETVWQTKAGETLLLLAALDGDIDSVNRLIDKSPDLINVANENGFTSLIAALYNSHNNVATILLDKGANPNLELVNGDSALTFAVKMKNIEITKTLLSHPAMIVTSNQLNNLMDAAEGNSAIMHFNDQMNPLNINLLLKKQKYILPIFQFLKLRQIICRAIIVIIDLNSNKIIIKDR